jgi:hypothetical protein
MKKPQTRMRGLCLICGEIFVLHNAGGVNGENPMFLCSDYGIQGRGEIDVGLLKYCIGIACFAIKHV